jgi:hypothetical protein
MDKIFRPYFKYAAAFINDFIIYSATEKNYLRYFEAVFNLPAERNIGFASIKSFFCYSSVIFFGFRVDVFGLYNTADRIEAIRNFKFPYTLAAFEKFIGFTSWLRHFIPRFVVKLSYF